MIEVRIMHDASPELLGAIEDLARAIENLMERIAGDARRVPETPSFAGPPEPVRAEPAGDAQAPLPGPSTAQPAEADAHPAPPAAAFSGGGKVWTPERDAYLLRAIEARTPAAEMLAAASKLPGAPIASVGAVYTRCGTLKQRGQPAPAQIEADIGQIRTWAGDLLAINAKRIKLDLPPFQLVRRRARAA